jgi:hypothetical protein
VEPKKKRKFSKVRISSKIEAIEAEEKKEESDESVI